MQPPSPDTLSPLQLTPQQIEQQKIEADRMQEVTLLLTNLFDREQTTLKAIFGCLYDIGACNFINQQIRPQPLRAFVKPIAKLTKPAFIFMGYCWFQKKCPPLITKWLQGKVKFPAKVPPKPLPPTPVPTVPFPPSGTEYVEYQIEIRRLRSRLRLTTGALVGMSATTLALVVLIQINLKPREPFWQSTATRQSGLIQSHSSSK
jgi:hypothetical protein